MENKRYYDIAVVGAGPSGAIFVKEIIKSRPDLKIVLIDGQTEELSKPCGGLLSPSAQKVLARLNMVLPKSVLVDPQIFAVQTMDIDQNITRLYQRCYLNMDRYAFDKWLISFASQKATIINGRCTKIEKEGDSYNLNVVTATEKIKLSANFIVGADGGSSIVRRTFFKGMKVQYVSIQQWYEDKGQNVPNYSCIFDAKTSDSCSWTIRKDKYLIYGGAFDKKGCREAFENQKVRLEKFLGNPFGKPVKTEACLVSSPRKMKDFCTGKERVFLVGEAAGFISASSFEGFSSALLSGKALADAFIKGKTYQQIQKEYSKNTRSLRHRLRKRAVKRALLCNPFIRKIVMKSGIQSISLYNN